MMFPKVSGENLERRKFTFPDDFEKDWNLVIIAFQREQQDDVDTWTPMVQRLTQQYKDLAYYELPTISAMNSVFQWFINSGMRSGISDRSARAATVTLYIDKEPFKRALEIPDEEHIYTLLVDGAGNILWRESGLWTQEKENDLTACMQRSA
ncbi:MAG: hypothetical protein NVSMB27_38010 [Ktedonobacteraceae bacterium]